MHKPENELITELQAAANEVAIGGVYSHYKDPTKFYKVINLAVTESDNTLCVIYQAQQGEQFIFVRPFASWLDQVEWNGTQVARFTRAS